MTTTADLKQANAKFDEILKKRARPVNQCDPNASPVAYQNLSVLKKLGKAKFPVYLTSSKVDQSTYAMKVFAHQGENPHPYFRNELRFSTLKHPHVISMVHHEEKRDTIQKGEIKRVSYILMEYAPHGDFFDFISKNGQHFDDKLIRCFITQLIEGIEYLHEQGVAHLDLKPENLLLGANFSLKIADFDLSHVRGDTKVLSRGTKYYRGPELSGAVVGGSSSENLKVSFASDIYSIGIIIFLLKSAGIYPHSEDTAFEGLNLADLMYNNNNKFWEKHAEIQEKPHSFFEDDFKELFNGMTKYNPEKRMTIEEIKKSKWFNGPMYTPFDFERKMKQILKC